MNQAGPVQLREALQWALDSTTDPAMAAADWLAKDIDPSCASAVDLLTRGGATVRQLRQAKDAYKTMRVLGETGSDRRMGGQLYLASIASAIVFHNERISRQGNSALGRALRQLVEDERAPLALRKLARDARALLDPDSSELSIWSNGSGSKQQQPEEDDAEDQPLPMEIERTFVLSRMPDLPRTAKVIRIEQGYLEQGGELEGRLRREWHADGTIRCTHTIKQGTGLVRSEQQREISASEFEKHWPATDGRRLTKTRYCVPCEELIWEIDQFEELKLVLAEVELPRVDTPAPPPPWLEPCIVREVTDEKDYRNYELALKLARGEV